MNFQSDGELEQLLGNLEQLAAKPAEKSKRRASNAEVNEILEEIVQLCYQDAHELAQPNRLAALEI
jgi:hypothetical protein